MQRIALALSDVLNTSDTLSTFLLDDTVPLEDRLEILGVDGDLRKAKVSRRIAEYRAAHDTGVKLIEDLRRLYMVRRETLAHAIQVAEKLRPSLLNAYLLWELFDDILAFVEPLKMRIEILERDPVKLALCIRHIEVDANLFNAREMLLPFANEFRYLIGETDLEPLQVEPASDVDPAAFFRNIAQQIAERVKEAKAEESDVEEKADTDVVPKKKRRARRRKKITATSQIVAQAEAHEAPQIELEHKLITNPNALSQEEKDARKRERALQIGAAHAESVRRREEARIQIEQFLLEAEAAQIVESLEGNWVFAEIFARASDKKISLRHVMTLTESIRNKINALRPGLGDRFRRMVESRGHYAHLSDTGDLLPRHYVDILRIAFILFGLVPEGWEGCSREDRLTAEILKKRT
jgi:hypothetical protein